MAYTFKSDTLAAECERRVIINIGEILAADKIPGVAAKLRSYDLVGGGIKDRVVI